MMVDDLKTEADSWQALVKKAAENVAQTKLRIKRAAEEKVSAEEEAEQAEGLSFPFPQRDVHVYQIAGAPPEKVGQPDDHTGADKSGLDDD